MARSEITRRQQKSFPMNLTDTIERHNLTEPHSNIRTPEEIIKAEEEFLGRPLSPHEKQMVHDRIEYLKQHQGVMELTRT
jgi:hypothetical protein